MQPSHPESFDLGPYHIHSLPVKDQKHRESILTTSANAASHLDAELLRANKRQSIKQALLRNFHLDIRDEADDYEVLPREELEKSASPCNPNDPEVKVKLKPSETVDVEAKESEPGQQGRSELYSDRDFSFPRPLWHATDIANDISVQTKLEVRTGDATPQTWNPRHLSSSFRVRNWNYNDSKRDTNEQQVPDQFFPRNTGIPVRSREEELSQRIDIFAKWLDEVQLCRRFDELDVKLKDMEKDNIHRLKKRVKALEKLVIELKSRVAYLEMESSERADQSEEECDSDSSWGCP
ncbi:hypothetical protein BDQ17DRAFT_1542069 [Cyathus striatus]|nr:hypothetical protein BDQ17DRAFT_1542069 [Cyathus striatus]